MNFKKIILNNNSFKRFVNPFVNPFENTFSVQKFCSQISVNSNERSSEVIPKESSIADKLYKTIEIEARSADRSVLNSYELFVKMTANYLGVTVSRCWEPFRAIKRRTLLRSAFVKKKYRVQYEFRTYFRNIEFKHTTGSTADTLLEYIERNLPEGVALKVYKTAIEPLPQHISHTVIPNITSGSNDDNKS